MIFTFFPDQPKERMGRKPYVKSKNPNPSNDWRAPEHVRMTVDVKRDFPRDDWGYPIRGSRRDQIAIDPRPAIMIPTRSTYLNPLC